RYVINDSLAWTEEIARYLLTMVAYLGGAIAIRKFTHIHVEFLYVYLPRRVAWALSIFVDLARIAFLVTGVYLGWIVTEIMHGQRMVIIDLPMSIVFGACTLGLAIMAVRAVQVAIHNWRSGTSPLLSVHEEGRHQ
ncbi:MAG: TRAP transporter small permease, partial [Alphaproteobacteria bacterium]